MDEDIKEFMYKHQKRQTSKLESASLNLSMKPTLENSNGSLSLSFEKDREPTPNKQKMIYLPNINTCIIKPGSVESEYLKRLKKNKFFKKKQLPPLEQPLATRTFSTEQSPKPTERNKILSAKETYDKYLALKAADFTPKVNTNNMIMAVLQHKFKKKKNAKLIQIYGISKRKEGIYKKLKNDRNLPFKDDFNVEDYQNIIKKLFKDNIIFYGISIRIICLFTQSFCSFSGTLEYKLF